MIICNLEAIDHKSPRLLKGTVWLAGLGAEVGRMESPRLHLLVFYTEGDLGAMHLYSTACTRYVVFP